MSNVAKRLLIKRRLSTRYHQCSTFESIKHTMASAPELAAVNVRKRSFATERLLVKSSHLPWFLRFGPVKSGLIPQQIRGTTSPHLFMCRVVITHCSSTQIRATLENDLKHATQPAKSVKLRLCFVGSNNLCSPKNPAALEKRCVRQLVYYDNCNLLQFQSAAQPRASRLKKACL